MPEGPRLFEQKVEIGGQLARVALARGVDRPGGLVYWLTRGSEDSARPGLHVRVPLGTGDALASGWLIEIIDGPRVAIVLERDGIDPARIKAIESMDGAESGGSLPGRLVELGRWISQYYCCPLGMALAGMVPAAVKRGTGSVKRTKLRRVVIEASQADAVVQSLSPSAKRAWALLEERETLERPTEARSLARELGLANAGPLNRLVRAGLLEEVGVMEVRTRGHTVPMRRDSSNASRLELTPEQTEGVRAIEAALGEFRGILLFGVTGSGKTEVYLRALQRVLERGEGAIVLVPEISLTPQTVGRFVDRVAPLGVEVAVLHSGLTGAQRHQEWSRVRKGEARVVIGARSAVFAPFGASEGSKLGLIIVDEEHDGSYKQDQLPRYHARDVALRRGQLEGCPVLLGSATPSLESWHNALARDSGGSGRFVRLDLPRRVGGGSLPRVEIVDLKEEERQNRRESPHLRAIGPVLHAALERTLAGGRGGQAILLLNRRGYASYVCCADQSCGWFMTCDHCDVTVVHHRSRELARRIVRCHHCQAEQTLPELCPQCGARVNTFGFGTQRLEHELEARFPLLVTGESLLRVDADTMKRAGDYFEALDRFGRGEVRVLMGTQMIAKGLDFPNVELIGVINADTALHLPDFRASERTFQLVAQVAGRAGRSAKSGRTSRVIVQTMNPGEPALVLASQHDFASFAGRELGLRREVGLPPVGRMARVVCRDTDDEKAEARAREVARAARASAPSSVRVKGPMACALSRVAGQYRWGVELLAPGAAGIQEVLAHLRGAKLVKSDAKTAVDVDPVALL